MEPEKYNQWGNPGTENKFHIFLSYVDLSFESLILCVLLWVPTEVSGLETDHGDKGLP